MNREDYTTQYREETVIEKETGKAMENGNNHQALRFGKIYTLSIDIETFSPEDLATAGVYRYAENPASELLLFAYSVNDDPVEQVDIAMGERIPDEILRALVDEEVEKWAFHANFERVFLSYWLGRNYPELMQGEVFLSPDSWRCSMVWSAYLGLPQSLDKVTKVLELPLQKLEEGRQLIRFFCTPAGSASDERATCVASCGKPDGCAPLLRDSPSPLPLDGSDRAISASSALPLLRHLPQQHADDWARFRAYNKRDVEVEQLLRQRLHFYPVPEKLWREYAMDQRINDRGILMDATFVVEARKMGERSRGKLFAELQALTGLENPNSPLQWKQWLAFHGIYIESADKTRLEMLLEDPLLPSELRPAIEKKLQYSHSSLNKYEAMEQAMCADGSARGMYRFYGANRTGRFSGHLIQLQNLPRTGDFVLPQSAEIVFAEPGQDTFGESDGRTVHPDSPSEVHAASANVASPPAGSLHVVRSLVRSGDYDGLLATGLDVPETLSRLIRTAFVPREGYKLYVADFSAIEARILAHLAGERWREEVFASGEDLYCASASRMFRVPVQKDGENSHLRRYGKIAELALGYGGSVGALQAMGADKLITEPNGLTELVNRWRASNPSIVNYWKVVEKAVKSAMRYLLTEEVGDIRFTIKGGLLYITLPSGRSLCYPRVSLQSGKYGPEITYMGMAKGSWGRQRTYGARLVENIVQGIARDVLTESMLRLERTHPEWHIVGHVHDEIILECPPYTDMQDVIAVMTQSPGWMPDLQLEAEGYVSAYYKN